MLSTIALSVLFALVLILIFIFFVSGQARRGHAVEDAGEKLRLRYMPVWFKEKAAALRPGRVEGEVIAMYVLEGEGADEGIVIADLKPLKTADIDKDMRYTTVGAFPYGGPHFTVRGSGTIPPELSKYCRYHPEEIEANGSYLLTYRYGRLLPPEEYGRLLTQLRELRKLLDA